MLKGILEQTMRGTVLRLAVFGSLQIVAGLVIIYHSLQQDFSLLDMYGFGFVISGAMIWGFCYAESAIVQGDDE